MCVCVHKLGVCLSGCVGMCNTMCMHGCVCMCGCGMRGCICVGCPAAVKTRAENEFAT